MAAQRTERYANRNPRRLESQISDLVALKEAQGGKLSARDQKQLEDLQKDIARVKKAREALGDKAPTFNVGRKREDGEAGRNNGRGDYKTLGKRNREDQEENSGSETDESVRRIPWPRDTPPPIPRQRHDRPEQSTNANSEPLGSNRRLPQRPEPGGEDHVPDITLPMKPPVRTIYESAPQVRDLKIEATARIKPAAVRKKIDATKGKGGMLLEEEEVERLEREGYGARQGSEAGTIEDRTERSVTVDAAAAIKGEDEAARAMKEEEERFALEMEKMAEVQGEQDRDPRGVRMEEVSDEDL